MKIIMDCSLVPFPAHHSPYILVFILPVYIEQFKKLQFKMRCQIRNVSYNVFFQNHT